MLETVLELKDLFNEKGYRYTAQREKILDILKQQSAEHLTAVDICVLVKKKYPKIGVATVYRTLSIFEKLNMIQKLGPDNGFNQKLYGICKDCLMKSM